ncbi:MAG: hypothetical protein OXC13_01910 [Caldilineaceae bacterium]|nr:hypothetical protein [Caldilineaceae bacterium]
MTEDKLQTARTIRQDPSLSLNYIWRAVGVSRTHPLYHYGTPEDKRR